MKTKTRFNRMPVEKQLSLIEKEREGKREASISSQSIAGFGLNGIISIFLGR